MNLRIYFGALFFMSLLLYSCILLPTDDDLILEEEEGGKFLLFHSNPEGKIGEGSYLSLLSIKNDELDYKYLTDIYPESWLMNNVDICNNKVVVGLHTNFNELNKPRRKNGGWFDLEGDGSWEKLPLLPPGEGRFSAITTTSVKISKSGHIFYISGSANALYGDDQRSSLVRYNPQTKELKTAIHPGPFAVNQPEIMWDTETASHGSLFYPSDDGRYVYGYAHTWGVQGGVVHSDYKILYKYDFKTETYTRIGNPGESKVQTLGITSDNQYLAYSSTVDGVFYRNLVNTSTNNVIKTKLSGGQSYSNTTRWNTSGFCSGETNNTIGIYNLISGTKHDIKTRSRPNFAQYDKNGSQIFFMIDTSKGKFLCKTSDNTIDASIDTVCALQANVIEFMVVK